MTQIGYHSTFMDRIIERAEERQKRTEKMIEKMLNKSEVILQAGKEPMTNEEYIRSCSTEELPKALKKMFFDIKSRVRSELGGYNELMKSERYFDDWLKEIHT